MSSDLELITFIFGIILTIIVSILMIKRMNINNNENVGCLVGGLIFIIMSFLCLPFSILLPQVIIKTIHHIDSPQYQGTVVDIESKWEQQTYTDSNNLSSTIDVLRHRAVIEFQDNTGQTITQLNPMSFDEEPDIGSTITVSYKNNNIREFSVRSISYLLLTIGILIVMIYLLILTFRYIAGKSNEVLVDKGVRFFAKVILPALMLILAIAAARAFNIISF